MCVVCSCVEFDCKNLLYKSNCYVSVTVIFTNKATAAIIVIVQRSTHMHFIGTTSARGELSLWNLTMPDTVSISVSSDLAVWVVTCH